MRTGAACSPLPPRLALSRRPLRRHHPRCCYVVINSDRMSSTSGSTGKRGNAGKMNELLIIATTSTNVIARKQFKLYGYHLKSLLNPIRLLINLEHVIVCERD